MKLILTFSLGVIRLLHDSSFKQNIEHCSTKDCYHLGIRYANSMDEIEAVIRVSNRCEQKIQVRKVKTICENIYNSWNNKHFICLEFRPIGWEIFNFNRYTYIYSV